MKKISEAIQGQHTDTQVTTNQMLTFIENALRHNRDVLVKVLEITSTSLDGIKTYDIYYQQEGENVNVVTPADSCVFVTANQTFEHELRGEFLKNDIHAAIDHTAEWGNLPFKTVINDNNTAIDCHAIWEDTSNVMYLVRMAPDTTATWRHIEDLVENFIRIIHELNNSNHADNQSIKNAIGHVNADDIAQFPYVYQLLLAFLPDRFHREMITRYHINLNNQNTQHNNEPAQLSVDTDDADALSANTDNLSAAQNAVSADAGNISADQHVEGHWQRAGVSAEISSDISADQTQTSALSGNGYEMINGLKYAGEWNPATDGQPGSNNNFAVMFGPGDIAWMRQFLTGFPAGSLATLSDKPVKYKGLAFSDYKGVRVFGHTENALKAYTDVCRNYMFFVFDSPNDIRWGMLAKGHKVFFRWNEGPTPKDMWNKMSGTGNGNDFIGFFYGRCRAEVRRASVPGAPTVQMTPIWDANHAAAMATTSAAKQQTAGNPGNAAQPKQMSAAQRRKFVETVIYNRLVQALAPAPDGNGGPSDYIKVPIVKRSEPTRIIMGSPAHVKIRFLPSHCMQLARSYDDWDWPAMRNYYYSHAVGQQIQSLGQKLTRLMDPTGIEPPPPKEVISLPPEEQQKLDNTLKAVNQKLGKAGIEVQITVPGHKPQYNWIQQLGSHQGDGWPENSGRYFAVMLTGLETTKYFGAEARQELQMMHLLDKLQPAFAEAQKAYGDIDWALCMDNGLPS